ncbi:type III-A CRISPR-associated RAMP protein Csm5 [Desulfobacterales bacterium HSG2]|nr:type III-A CRISPR-associated RAMP protein Csm5 [Desulfobacterales bacterium HSG2]
MTVDGCQLTVETDNRQLSTVNRQLSTVNRQPSTDNPGDIMPLPQYTHYRVNLHILSPIHVGAGQELDPFSYIIRDRTLFLIDLIKWMEVYPEPDKLYRMMDSDNFANIRSFIAENFNFEGAIRCAIPVDNPKLLEVYQRAIQKKDPKNQVLISPMTRNEISTRAYIPGSSIKGAIRTAIANYFVKIAKVTSRDFRGRDDYNKKIFGQINKDPMRCMKLSDISMGSPGTVIVESKEFPLDPDKALTPKGHTEVTFSLCHTGKPLTYPLRFSMAPFELHKKRIDLKFLVNALYEFYAPKYEAEYRKFYQSPRASKVQQGMFPMNQAVSELRANETLIRIGHFSHVECITLDDVRKPKTRIGKDGKPLPWGKTRTLANGIYPFGWAKLEFLDLESAPRPEKKWPFSESAPDQRGRQRTFETAFKPIDRGPIVRDRKKKPVRQKPVSPLKKLIEELGVVRANDMGRIGTIMQKIDILETDAEKAALAEAIRDKIGPKAFKKHKKKKYLMELMAKK